MECLHGGRATAISTKKGMFWVCNKNNPKCCEFFCPEQDRSLFDTAMMMWRANGAIRPLCDTHQRPSRMRVVKDIIPKCLSIPLVAAANHIGVHPVACLWSSLINNWKIKDKARPALDISNIDMQSLYTGSSEEAWFFLIHWDIEIQSVPGIKSVAAAQKAVLDDNQELLRACLIILRNTIQKLKISLKRISEKCNPAFFYTKLRTFLTGWKNNKSLPDGIIYEGVSSKPFQFSGASGAQSTGFHLFDAALSITHEDGEKAFLDSMLGYMPRGHRRFVKEIRREPSIRDYVVRSENSELLKLYNECVESLVQFRSLHVQVVTRRVQYLILFHITRLTPYIY
ncbi:indoleamine 2,3-dioxygenase 2-like [Dendronephthya gigantea]|uniref:indoleamine 2,3-dioxygenase 2-like n=1 Tax=Dendronephthya gigantea TaxID=151771 RepID=UPI00106D230A|nr:indoleamine 2,3-dioxygenase 2-like [Dendronephthya gigantea]